MGIRCNTTFSSNGITVDFLGVDGSTYNYLVTNSPTSGLNIIFVIFNVPCDSLLECSITPMNSGDICGTSTDGTSCQPEVINGPVFIFSTSPIPPGSTGNLSFTISQTLSIGNILLGIGTNQFNLCGSICGPLCP
jgi:hypothetical protein